MTVAVLALAAPAMAVNYRFPVTTTSDGFTAPCVATTSASGPPADPTCTLREAIAAANPVGANGFVEIPAGTYTLTQGELAISGRIHVTGAGARSTVISGGDASRVFSNTSGSPGAEISDLTATHGHSSGSGGAIYNDFGTLNLARVAVLDSTADGTGGGVATEDGGRLNIDRSLIARNTATNANGGGLFINGAGSAGATVTNTTIANNSATGTGQGGGIYLGVSGTSATLTFATLNNDTIADNTASAGLNLARNPGSGSSELPPGTWTVRNSVVSKPASATVANCSFQIATQNNDLVTDASCLGALPPNGSTSFAEPSLQPLADNGGPTDTMAPDVDNSDVVDNGDSATCTSTDQRGFARGVASPDTGPRCDIGAYEVIQDGNATLTADGPATGHVGDQLTYHLNVSLSGPTDNASQARVTYTLPAELQLVAATATNGTCGAGVCNLRVAGGQTGQVTLVAKPTTTGHVTVSASLWTPGWDADFGDNDASASSDVTPAPPPPPEQQQAQQPRGEQQVLGTQVARDLTAPVLTHLGLKRNKVRFVLSEPATLRFSVTQKKRGRHGRKRTVTLTSFSKDGKAGANSFKLGRKLKRGSYRLVAVATDAAGNKAKPVSVGFRVK